MRRADSGFNLVELLVAMAVTALSLSLAAPSLDRLSAGIRLRLAAGEVTGALQQARAFAIAHDCKVGVKFRTEADGSVSFALYRDGDGDGVRNDDIVAGVDPMAEPGRTLEHLGRRARFGFPPGGAPRDPADPSRRLARRDDPIRFNRSDLASFSPLEGSTPGSVYLTDGQRRLVVVRLDSRSGRPHLLVWDPDADRWR
jgi:prepilin-type N-terminal cleavage/methylation domain-containing protein